MPCKWQTPRESDRIRDWGYGCCSPRNEKHFRCLHLCKPGANDWFVDCYEEAKPEEAKRP